jgi:putative transposase
MKEGIFMPRKSRELMDLGIYHIVGRGNNRQKLYQEKADYEQKIALLLRAKQKWTFELFHYCLMPNHFHLLVRVQKGADLPSIMRETLLAYTRYCKRKYRFMGHLFQGRFKSPRIPEESYYLQCGRYIERNPVKAKMVSEAWHYPYSSACFYISGKSDSLITPNLYYQQMGSSDTERQEAYRRFLLQDEPYRSIVDAELLSD